VVESGRGRKMVMFMGEYRHNLDTKNRLIIPAKFRDQLTSNVYVTEWMDGCLAAYAEDEWNELVSKLNRLPKTNAAARSYVRRITGKADACQIDSQGRILLPQFLVKDTEIDKECVIVGVSDHFEIWSEKRYDTYDETSSDSFEDLAESLTSLLQ
jgi:MraZ protein